MRNILFFLISFISCYSVNAQELSAKYDVTRQIVAPGTGEPEILANVKLEGFYYSKDKKIITYLKPLYLDDFPTGNIVKKTDDFNYKTYGIRMDPLQSLVYCDMDSMVRRSRMEFSGLNAKGANIKSGITFGKNKWQIFPETKMINNLECQRATLNNRKGELYCEVWFAKDIKTPIGLYGLTDVPGLLVEGEVFGTHEKFTLVWYSFDSLIDDHIFWPTEFNEPFN